MQRRYIAMLVTRAIAVVYAFGLLDALPPAQAQDNAAARAARQWRQSHERQSLADYFEFLKIPNVSHDLPNVRRNADYLMRAMEKRGLKPRLLEVPGAPSAVYGEILVPGATHTYVFYSHTMASHSIQRNGQRRRSNPRCERRGSIAADKRYHSLRPASASNLSGGFTHAPRLMRRPRYSRC